MQKSAAYDWLMKFTDGDDLKFDDCFEGYKQLYSALEEYPELSNYTLAAVRDSLKYSGFCPDTAPMAMRLFCKAAEHVKDEKLTSEFDKISEQKPDFAARCVPDLLKTHAYMVQYFFDTTMEHSKDCGPNGGYVFGVAALAAIRSAEQGADKMVDTATKSEDIGASIYSNIDKIYEKHFELGGQLLDILEERLTPKKQGDFYKNLAYMAVSNPTIDENTVYVDDSRPIDSTIPERCIELMEKHVDDKDQDHSALSALYKSAGQMRDIFPEYEERLTKVIKKGLEHPKNNKISQKVAYRVLGDYEKLCSKVSVHKRTIKSDENPYGFENVSDVDNEKPCVLALGGDGVRFEKELNGYLGEIYRLMEKHDLQDKVNIYGVIYDFGEYMDVNWARTKLMQEHHRNVRDKELNAETKDPKYIKDIFDDFIEPRLSNSGRRFSAKKAAKNIRKLQIFAHCHGAYTALKLEEMMQKRMAELGYDKESREFVQKQLLIVTQSPYCPLGCSKSTMVSFASARDFETSHHNNFELALDAVRREEKIPLSYFPDDRGNLFLADNMGKGCDEHNFWGFRVSPMNSEDGAKLVEMEGNVLVNGVKNAVEGKKELGDVKELIADDECFETVKANGTKLYNKMYAIAMAVAKYRAEHEQ